MTIVIGICGNSCSGKSTNTNFVNNQPIWNSPVDVAFNKLIKTVFNLKNNKTGYMPNKAFTEKYDKELKPNKIILIEGFLIYTNKELVSLIDKKIFLDIDNNELIKRRLLRNSNENKDFSKKAVIESARKYEKIQKNNSDLIINSNQKIENTLIEIEKFILN